MQALCAKAAFSALYLQSGWRRDMIAREIEADAEQLVQISKELKTVSDTVIYLHRELFDESLSPMKLQKLCYYAQGFSMAGGDGQLFEEDFQAWQHGPVIPELWQKYRNYKWRQIEDEVSEPSESPLTELLDEIVSSFGRYDGAALSTMTHRETPWIAARGGIPETDGSTSIIPKDSIEAFFKAKLKAYA